MSAGCDQQAKRLACALRKISPRSTKGPLREHHRGCAAALRQDITLFHDGRNRTRADTAVRLRHHSVVPGAANQQE